MAQQAQFEKLKEQIEAAKRSLTEMSEVEIDDSSDNPPFAGSAHNSAPVASSQIAETKQIRKNLDNVTSRDSCNTRVVDMTPKTVLSETPVTVDALSNSANAPADEFQFFHREKQPKGGSDFELDVSLEEANNVKSEALMFERLGSRLATLEGDVEQNRKYILELINLLSKLNLRQKPANRKLKPSKRLNRRHIFWLVIGFLAVGWFGLTPSGHIAVKHFLTFM